MARSVSDPTHWIDPPKDAVVIRSFVLSFLLPLGPFRIRLQVIDNFMRSSLEETNENVRNNHIIHEHKY